MSNFATIEEFNIYASEHITNLTINEYINKVHPLFNKELDISFMEYFTDIIKHRNEFYIHHSKLQDYGVINNIETSAKIERCLEQFNLVKDEDYQVSNVGQVRTTAEGQNRGEVIKKVYHLTPYAFKLCLMRAKNTKKYAYYYLFLEECIMYYNEYQILYKNILLSGKDTKIDNLQKKIDEILGYTKDVKEQNNDLNENINDLHEKVDDLNEEVNEVKEHLNNTTTKLDSATEDRAPKTENIKFQNSFIIFKIGLLKYYILKCQKQSINTSIRKLKLKYADEFGEILRIDYNPNTINLFQRFKEIYKQNLKVKHSEITLKNMTEIELKNVIQELNNKKKNVNIP